jgi:hypothetical protein
VKIKYRTQNTEYSVQDDSAVFEEYDVWSLNS